MSKEHSLSSDNAFIFWNVLFDYTMSLNVTFTLDACCCFAPEFLLGERISVHLSSNICKLSTTLLNLLANAWSPVTSLRQLILLYDDFLWAKHSTRRANDLSVLSLDCHVDKLQYTHGPKLFTGEMHRHTYRSLSEKSNLWCRLELLAVGKVIQRMGYNLIFWDSKTAADIQASGMQKQQQFKATRAPQE